MSATLPRADGRPGPAAARRPLLIAVGVTALAGVWFTAGWGGQMVIRYVDDIGCGVAAVIGALAAWGVARFGRPEYRRAWGLLAAGACAWAMGEVVWTVVDLAGGSATMNALFADIGFLLLPVLALAAILQLPSDDGYRARGRWLLDGGIVALSICFVLWNSVIEHMTGVHLNGVKLVANAAFPLVDIALLTAVVLAASYASVGQTRLWMLAAALTMLAIGDSGFAYLSATDRYAPGAFCDVAYIGAFAMLTAAASLPHGIPPVRDRVLVPPGARIALPHVPLAAAAVDTVYSLAAGRPVSAAALALFTALAGLVIARQYLAMLDNRRLVEDLRLQREQLRTFTLTDPLTGIGNRVVFGDRVRHALELHARDRRPLALCWIDLDDFKVVNDTYGHAVGDEVLVGLAGRMAAVLRAGDTLARVGGDEFAVLVEDGGDPVAVAEKLLACTEPPLLVAGHRIRAGMSIGLAVLTGADAAIGSEELMSRADVAMYAAKDLHKRHIATYRRGMKVPGSEDAPLREPLKQAITRGAIGVEYQPVVDAHTGVVYGFEALARWSVDGQAVPPSRFMPLTERMGLARELGFQILSAAIEQLGVWSRQRGDDSLVIAANLSPDQLVDTDLPATVAELLRRNGVQPHQLDLEITERALLTDNPDAFTTAQALTDLGVTLALDDFGTGHSSLAHLRVFPLAALKIDRTFIADVDIDPHAREFLSAVARLGRDLGLKLIAEGVERSTQLEVVRGLGHMLVQGYLFAAAQPAKDLDALVAQPVPTLHAHPRDIDALRMPKRPTLPAHAESYTSSG